MTSGKPENLVYPLVKNDAPRIVRAMPVRNKMPRLGQVALVKGHRVARQGLIVTQGTTTRLGGQTNLIRVLEMIHRQIMMDPMNRLDLETVPTITRPILG